MVNIEIERKEQGKIQLFPHKQLFSGWLFIQFLIG